MKREKEVEALKLIIAENMAKYSKAGMPYEEALKMCALGILASGFGKVDELNDEIAGLTGKVEALQKDNENLRRTLEEGREAVDEGKRKTAEDIVDLLIQYDDGDSNTEAVELIVERYGLQDLYQREFLCARRRGLRMKDFHYVTEKGEVGASDYYEKKRETVLETIKPICEAFEITDYDYEIKDNGGWCAAEVLAVEGERLTCTANSIAATVRTLVKFISARL